LLRNVARFALLCVLPLTSASAQVKIGLMVSATGPTAAIGIPQKNTAALLPTRAGDTSIQYIQLEDGGDTTRAVQNVKKLIGEDNVVRDLEPSMGSEDFSFMLQRCPGAYARLGQGGAEGGCFLHNSRYDFNDDVIPLGAGYLAALAEHALPLSP